MNVVKSKGCARKLLKLASSVRALLKPKLMQSSEQVNNIAPNYSPEGETEKPFTRKRKENDLDGKVLCVF